MIIGVVTKRFIRGGNSFPIAFLRRELAGLVAGVDVVSQTKPIRIRPGKNPAVDDDVRIRFPHSGEDAEIFLRRNLVRRVEPENVGMIICYEFENLRNSFFVHILPDLRQKLRIRQPPIRAVKQFVTTGIRPVPVVARAILLTPIERVRVVESEFDAVLLACCRQILHGIVMPRRGIYHIPRASFRIKHRKTIVMFGGDDEVAHAGVFREFDPGIGVEVRGIESAGDLLVIYRHGNFRHALDMLGVTLIRPAIPRSTQHRGNTPMHEHPEACLTPPGNARVMFSRGGGQRFNRRRARWFVGGGLQPHHGSEANYDDSKKMFHGLLNVVVQL